MKRKPTKMQNMLFRLAVSSQLLGIIGTLPMTLWAELPAWVPVLFSFNIGILLIGAKIQSRRPSGSSEKNGKGENL
jgi:hypothetical protein